jgi:hypothetical protein
MKHVLSLLLLSLAASTAEAQDNTCGAPSTLRGFVVEDSALGAWAEYVALEGNAPVSTMGFRVFVAEGFFEGKTRRWLEMWLERSGRIALRVPVEEENAGMHVKLGHTIFYLPPDQANAKAGGACRGPGDDKVAAPKPFKVIAGTFECQYAKRVYNGNTFEYWMSKDVPPLQLVKALFPGGRGYELIATGTGAKSVFPERFVAVPFPDADSVSGLLPLDMRKRVEERKTSVSAPDAGVAPPLPPLKQWGVDAGVP